MSATVIFDFDGTLVDSEAALIAPFAALGVDPERIPLGLPAEAACRLAGITLEAYLSAYDTSAAEPFSGVEELLAELPIWALCSNKARDSGVRELARLGWSPAVARFTEDFRGAPKELGPVLEALGVSAADALYVGDTDHDRTCAHAAGVRFVLASWNPRAAAASGDLLAARPADVLDLVTG